MTIPRRPIYHLLSVLAIAALMMTTGCASFFQTLDESMQRNRFPSDYESLDRALKVYAEGDFATALVRFKSLAATSGSLKIRRKARLGEVCCHLMLAENAETYAAAVDMWHEFAASRERQDGIWDPVLIGPLIVHGSPGRCAKEEAAITTKQTDFAPPAKTRSNQPASSEPPAKSAGSAELSDLKKRAQAAENLQRRLDEVICENQSLKEKIKALETIDQNIQKKKTEIAKPGE